VIAPLWIWLVFIFVFGCCVGSFLNVVIYRLPRDKSIVKPPSACPACGRHIRFYDNIPLVSWLLLGGKCRFCKAKISPQYFIIELLTGLLFTLLFYLYFNLQIRVGIESFLTGGWLMFLIHISLLSAFIAASAIDLKLWVIPVAICWFVTTLGILGSAIAGYVIEPEIIRTNLLLPTTTTFLLKEVTVASLAVGAAVGLAIALFLLKKGIIKRSYDSDVPQNPTPQERNQKEQFNDRAEMVKEILFLLPIIICAVAAYWIAKIPAVNSWCLNVSQIPFVAGLTGSLFGYFVGCAVVWATRILGTFAFGREAMGLGDVHLMGAAGAVIGPFFVILAFFIAPFFGLTWAMFQMISQKTRQIPYGPFLSLAVFTVIILHDWIFRYFAVVFYH